MNASTAEGHQIDLFRRVHPIVFNQVLNINQASTRQTNQEIAAIMEVRKAKNLCLKS